MRHAQASKSSVQASDRGRCVSGVGVSSRDWNGQPSPVRRSRGIRCRWHSTAGRVRADSPVHGHAQPTGPSTRAAGRALPARSVPSGTSVEPLSKPGHHHWRIRVARRVSLVVPLTFEALLARPYADAAAADPAARHRRRAARSASSGRTAGAVARPEQSDKAVQSITAMASISTRRSGVNSAATPISVPGASSATPSFFSARARPSCTSDILSRLQSAM